MPFADTVFQDWDDCIWQNWTDCVWDKFSIVYQDRKTRTMRQLPPEGSGNFRRPYLEGNPSYVEDNRRSPDVALANVRARTTGEVQPHMTFKQSYRYDQFQKMKYKNVPPFPHEEARLPDETPAGIGGYAFEWQWVRYFDNARWTPTTGEWFDNRWLEKATVWTQHLDDSDWYDYYGSMGGSSPQITWDGTKWTSTVDGAALQELGTWVESYRPDYIKINYSGALEWKLIDSGDSDIVTRAVYTSGQQVTINWGNNAIKRIKFYWDTDDIITNIQFGELGGIDLSVKGNWYKTLRPTKFRMEFANATANVSLQDKNGTEIYANATYASGDEVYLDFAGAEDISRLVVSGSGDITDIEFLQQIEAGNYIASDQRSPRTQSSPGREINYGAGGDEYIEPNPIHEPERLPTPPLLPDPVRIHQSERLARGRIATKGKREKRVKINGKWVQVLY